MDNLPNAAATTVTAAVAAAKTVATTESKEEDISISSPFLLLLPFLLFYFGWIKRLKKQQIFLVTPTLQCTSFFSSLFCVGHRSHQHRLRKTQYYLLEVVAKRDQLLQDKRMLETYTTHPWNR
eukprot:TRINITY_DN1263_c0_g1_i1.p2 TRINITY_DN1263_c0_g1~~TRINITY_DN1263_c0_g1_i1.p2  ORF type:complete len:123 (-),score=28.56 TRINITY_DN1263_c0_g1_i1:434-802(-)